MKAIILDYRDGDVSVLQIPKNAEEDPCDYVETVIDASNCSYMIVDKDSVPVYQMSVTDDDTKYERIGEL